MGKFPVGKFPGFPEILPGEVSRREVSRISRNFPDGKFPGFPEIPEENFHHKKIKPHTFPE